VNRYLVPSREKLRIPKFLVIASDKKIRLIIDERLSRNKCDVFTLDNMRLIERVLRRHHFDFIIIDMSFKTHGEHGTFDLFRQIKSIDSSTKVCFLTRFRVNQEEFFKLFPSTHPDFIFTKEDIDSDRFLNLYNGAR
jgi:DNA-binding NtrC family response regulator